MEDLKKQIDQLKEDRKTHLDWLNYCLRQQDWHGVMDASADIREIEAKLSVLEPLLKSQYEKKE